MDNIIKQEVTPTYVLTIERGLPGYVVIGQRVGFDGKVCVRPTFIETARSLEDAEFLMKDAKFMMFNC
jgi:hypothetical protein